MDPISQVSTVIGLFQTAWQLKELWDKYQDAPAEVADTVLQCQVTESMLKGVEGSLRASRRIIEKSVNRESILFCLNTSVTGITGILNEMAAELPKANKKKTSKLGFWDKTKFIWKKEFFTDSLARIAQQQSVIQVVLMMISVQGISQSGNQVATKSTEKLDKSTASKSTDKALSNLSPGATPMKHSKSDSQLNKTSKTDEEFAKDIRDALKAKAVDVERVLELGAPLELHLNSRQDHALHIAARSGNLQIIYVLLRHGARLNARNKNGDTPLMAALIDGQEKASLTLLGAGAKTSLRNNVGKTALHQAAHGSLLLALQCLLASGADANATDDDGSNALHFATAPRNKDGKSIKADIEVLKCLLNAGTNPTTALKKSGLTPIHTLAREGLHEQLDLVAQKADNLDIHASLDNADKGATPLLLAAYYGKFSALKVLIKHGANVNEPSPPDTDTMLPNALWAALEQHNLSSAGRLLKSGADPDSLGGPKTNMHSYLCRAASVGAMDIIQLLIKHKATIDLKSGRGDTPLALTAQKNQVKAMELLINNGADFNSANKRQMTAVMEAAENGNLPALHLLCKKGADWRICTNVKFTAFTAAVNKGYLDCAAYILALGADIEEETTGGFRALHYAASNGKLDAVKWLVALGADTTASATEIRSPFRAIGTAEEVARVHEKQKAADYLASVLDNK